MKTTALDHFIVKNILKPHYLQYDIEGAPFQIGTKVKILNNPLKDDTFDKKYKNLIGQVFYFEYDCGCGQTFPEDPMIGVKFSNSKIAEFWKEELQIII